MAGDLVAGRHALYAYLIAAAIVASVVRIDVDVPLVGHLGSALVAITLLYAPVMVAWRRKEDLIDYGFKAEPLGRGLALGFGYVALIFPLFAIGYFAFYEVTCSSHGAFHDLAIPGACKKFYGLAGLHAPKLTMELAQFVAVQVVVVALPEELFFRGCLLELLERRFPPRRRILGGGIGLALLISSLMFALIHLPRNGDPRALATFFPALVFGWMRSSTGSILAPVIAHASSNVLVRLLDLMVLR